MYRNPPSPRINLSIFKIPNILLSALFMALVFILESMHWLQFRGPNASGIAPENADPPVHFSADTNLLWKTEMLPGWSSPCIVNDKIFLTGFNDSDSLLYTVALNRENGGILWKDSRTPHNYYFLTRSIPMQVQLWQVMERKSLPISQIMD
jgi:hypothetical protein